MEDSLCPEDPSIPKETLVLYPVLRIHFSGFLNSSEYGFNSVSYRWVCRRFKISNDSSETSNNAFETSTWGWQNNRRAEIPFNIPNSTNHFWATETSLKFPRTAKEAEITKSPVGTDIVVSFSEFIWLCRRNNFGIVEVIKNIFTVTGVVIQDYKEHETFWSGRWRSRKIHDNKWD